MRETLSFRPRFQRWLHKPCEPSVHQIPELNGLRVLLVFIVSWYHFWQQSWLTPHTRWRPRTTRLGRGATGAWLPTPRPGRRSHDT